MRTYPIVLLLVAACAKEPQYYWDRPGASVEDGYRDRAACEQAAYSLHPMASTEQGVRVYAACMQARGWRLQER